MVNQMAEWRFGLQRSLEDDQAVAITLGALKGRHWTMVSIETGSIAGALRRGTTFLDEFEGFVTAGEILVTPSASTKVH